MPDTWRLGSDGEPARTAIVGCGGAGCNTLRHAAPTPYVERIALNDTPHPSMVGIARRILLPAGPLEAIAALQEKSVPSLATREEKDVADALADRDFVVVLGGLGGDVGGWGMGVVGRVARILGDTSIALATIPFTAEGIVRRQTAEAQLAVLRDRVDGLVAFGNDGLLRAFPSLPLTRAFAALGAVMARPANGLASVLGRADLTPMKRMLARAKEWRFGMGAGEGKHRTFLAVEEAYRSPWFTGRHEDVRQAVALLGQPASESLEEEVLHEIRLRSPRADVAWAILPEAVASERLTVTLLAGLDVRF